MRASTHSPRPLIPSGFLNILKTVLRKPAAEANAYPIELENGGLATLELTTAARPKDVEASITITGTRGVVKIGGVALNKIEQWNFADGLDDENETKRNFSEEVDNGYGISHYRQLKKIFETYQVGKSYKVPFLAVECLHTLKLIHSIYASIELNRKVALSENLSSSKLGLKNDTE